MPESLLLLFNCNLFFHARKSTSSLQLQPFLPCQKVYFSWKKMLQLKRRSRLSGMEENVAVEEKK
jgi:hypothetical protein